MIVNTGHKTFYKLANGPRDYVGRGSVVGGVHNLITAFGANNKLIVYQFRTWEGDKVRVQGWIVTTDQHRVIGRVCTNQRGRMIIDAMADALEKGA